MGVCHFFIGYQLPDEVQKLVHWERSTEIYAMYTYRKDRIYFTKQVKRKAKDFMRKTCVIHSKIT